MPPVLVPWARDWYAPHRRDARRPEEPPILHILELLAGLATVLLVLGDVFGSVLVPRPSHSRVRIGPALNRVLAPLWRRAAGRFRSPRLRQDLRGSLAPAILVAAGAGWIAGLSLGFALMLHALPGDVDLENFGFGEALFQASLAVSTLGMIHAEIHGWGRAVVALAGISGFSVLTLVVAFLLSVQNALHQRETLVLTLPGRAGRPPSAVALLDAYAGACDDELAALFAQWEEWTAQVLQNHLSYPVLFRFRSLDESAEWLLCLAAVLDLAAVVIAAEPAELPRSRRAAGFLNSTATRAVREFARFFGLGDARGGLDGGTLARLEQALARTRLAPDRPAAFAERLDGVRAGYAGRLPLIAGALDLVWYDPLTGTPA